MKVKKGPFTIKKIIIVFIFIIALSCICKAATPTVTPTITPSSTPTPMTVISGCANGMVIDGAMNESPWNSVGWTSIAKLALGSNPDNVSANFKTLWDMNYLYIGFSVNDAYLHATQTACDAYNDSAVEIYMDMNNDWGAETFPATPGDLHFMISYDCLQFCQNDTVALPPSGVEYASNTNASGYTMELAIPWTLLGATPNAGTSFEFDVQVDFNDGTGTRVGQLVWNGDQNDYQSSTNFGIDQLSNCPSPTETITPTITLTPVPVPAGNQNISNYNLAPATVSTGQQDVYTVMYTISNPSNGTAMITGITLTVRDGQANLIQASSALSGLGIRDVNSYYFSTSSTTSSSFIYCPMPSAIQVGPNAQKNIYVVADITGNTTNHAANFQIGIDSPLNITAVDFATGNTLTVSAAAGFLFPMGSSDTVIQNSATELLISDISTMPVSASTGQSNVKAMELNFSDAGNTVTASIKISSITLDIKDAAGNSIAASSAINDIKITSNDGSFIYGEAAAGTSNMITIVLSAPLIVPSTQALTCALMLDMTNTFTATSCMVSLDSQNNLYAVDANSGVPVGVSSLTSFPLQSGPAVIQKNVSNININTFTALLPAGVVLGQKWVELFDFQISDTLGPQSAAAHFNSLTITVENGAGAPAASNGAVGMFYITDNSGNTLGSAATGAGSDTGIVMTNPYIFTSGVSQNFRVFCDILATAYSQNFEVAIQGPGYISVTDANSGYNAGITATPSLPWITGNAAIYVAPATNLNMWHNGNIVPTQIGMGQPGVKFMILYMSNPGYIGTADIQLDGITLTAFDTKGNTLAGAKLFSNVYLTDLSGNVYGTFNAVSSTANLPFYLAVNPTTPFLIEALNTITAYVSADISMNAPYGSFLIGITSPGSVACNSVPSGYITVTAAAPDAFPVDSNITTITPLAYNFEVGHENLMPKSAVRGQKSIDALQLNFENFNAVPIAVTSLAIAIKDKDGLQIPANMVIGNMYIKDMNNNVLASAAAGNNANINFIISSFQVFQGNIKSLKITVDISMNAQEPFYVEFENGADAGTLPPAGVTPIQGDFFGNMKSSLVSIQAPDLEQSYHVFPNPVNPQQSPAHIEYYIENNSEVTIKIFTVNGDLVKTVINKNLKPAGLHFEDTWNAVNETGHDVISGVYLCVIEVDDQSTGQVTKLMKKLAVLR